MQVTTFAKVKLNIDLANIIAPAVKEVLSNDGIEMIVAHFESRQASWQALKAATIRQRKRLGYGPSPILVRRGDDGGLLERIRKNTQIEVTIGKKKVSFTLTLANDVVASTLNNGGGNNIPSRQFFDLTDEDRQKLYTAIARKLTNG